MALLKQNSDRVLLQEGTACSQLLLQDEVVICDGGTDALVLTGVAPSAEIDHYRGAGLETVALTGIVPTVQVDAPRLTSLGTATLTGKGSSAQVDAPRAPSLGTGTITGTVPVTYIAHSGTSISNTTADSTRISHINACAYSGFQAKPNELVPTDDGVMVLPEFWEDTFEQRPTRRDKVGAGPVRPESEALNVEDLYPNGVSVDDL